MTKREELDAFLERADELIDSKYILADIKIANMLKAIAASNTLLALFKNCLTDFDYSAAQKKYLVKSKYLSMDKGEFVLPPNSRELLAFVFNVLVDLDAKRLIMGDFINKYFYEDGSFSSGYDLFISSMIKPFKNTVKMLMDSVIDGKLQDPVDALNEEEAKKAKEREEKERNEQREKELSKRAYGTNIRKIKVMLVEDKKRVKASKLKVVIKNQITLVIDMLANVLDSEDVDAIEYAYVAYKYVAKAHPVLFFKRAKNIAFLLKGIVNVI